MAATGERSSWLASETKRRWVDYAFGEFEFNVAAADPTVTFRLVAQDGSIVHEMTLPRSTLIPPAG